MIILSRIYIDCGEKLNFEIIFLNFKFFYEILYVYSFQVRPSHIGSFFFNTIIQLYRY